MTTIEKMAKATYVKWVEDVQDLEPPWDDLPKSHRDRLIDATRAALQAIREPSPEMVKAASESAADDGEGGNFGPLCDLLDFSGENKTRLVVAEALRQAVGAILEEKPE